MRVRALCSCEFVRVSMCLCRGQCSCMHVCMCTYFLRVCVRTCRDQRSCVYVCTCTGYVLVCVCLYRGQRSCRSVFVHVCAYMHSLRARMYVCAEVNTRACGDQFWSKYVCRCAYSVCECVLNFGSLSNMPCNEK